MSTISMNNVAGFKSDLNANNEAAAQSPKELEKPVNNLGFVPKSNTSQSFDNAESGDRQVTVSADALDKMLEMFELVLKAMRNFLSGWGGSSKLPVDVKSPPVTSVKPDVQMRAGAEGRVLVDVKDADSQTPPANDEPVAKGKLGMQIPPSTDSSVLAAQGTEKDALLNASADGDAQVMVMPDGSTQVNLTPESGKQYRISLAAGVQVKVTSHDGSTTASSIKPRLIIDEAKVDEPSGAALITETRTASQLRAEAKTLAATPSAFKTEAEMKADAEGKVDTVLDAGAQTTTATEAKHEHEHEHEHATAAHKDVELETTAKADSEIKARPGITSPAPAAGRPIFGRFG
ncbi:filamentous adhesin [Pseudomonas trivialis]|nr:filamentous adhesin [Pseudomonas trivialis]